MLSVLSAASDKLVSFVAPKADASARGCWEVDNWCNGDCPFWWWRRVHRMNCSDGYKYNRYECCGCGC
jgi:hypothetical protein